MKHNSRLVIILLSICFLVFFEGERLKQSINWGNSPPDNSVREIIFSMNDNGNVQLYVVKDDTK